MIRSLRLWLPLCLLGAGVVGYRAIVVTGPRVESRAPDLASPLIRTHTVELEDLNLTVLTQGTVEPRTESDLVPEISGPLVWVSPRLVSGGFFEAGETLLRVDPTDFQLAVERARAEVSRSRSELELARKDLKRRRGLAARQVESIEQLDRAQSTAEVAAARLRVARASLSQAERDLEKTEIRAPYNGRVREEHVGVGQFVTRGVSVARLYSTDFAEVRLPVADAELAYLSLPLSLGDRDEYETGPGPQVTLRAHFAGGEFVWHGRIVRTEGEIDPKTRMVRVVARVEDPYGRHRAEQTAPLAVGLFVEAEIQGRAVHEVAVIPRAALRQGDRVLVVDDESRLRFRTVQVLRRRRNDVVIEAGLSAGDRVCVSPLETVVDGMSVRLAEKVPEPIQESGGPATGGAAS
ncbi:MAG: efflux RND transporter periplasmic adaptor subunit [Myxococcota bacterium]